MTWISLMIGVSYSKARVKIVIWKQSTKMSSFLSLSGGYGSVCFWILRNKGDKCFYVELFYFTKGSL